MWDQLWHNGPLVETLSLRKPNDDPSTLPNVTQHYCVILECSKLNMLVWAWLWWGLVLIGELPTAKERSFAGDAITDQNITFSAKVILLRPLRTLVPSATKKRTLLQEACTVGRPTFLWCMLIVHSNLCIAKSTAPCFFQLLWALLFIVTNNFIFSITGNMLLPVFDNSSIF